MSATTGHTATINNDTHLVDHLCSAEYVIAVLKYLLDEMRVKKWVLQLGKGSGVSAMLNGWEDMPGLPKERNPKVGPVRRAWNKLSASRTRSVQSCDHTWQIR